MHPRPSVSMRSIEMFGVFQTASGEYTPIEPPVLRG